MVLMKKTLTILLAASLTACATTESDLATTTDVANRMNITATSRDGQALTAKVYKEMTDVHETQNTEMMSEVTKTDLTDSIEAKELKVPNVYFGFDSTTLNSSHPKALKNLANQLSHSNYKEVKIVGYADTIGSEDYNQELSIKRAQAIKEKLSQWGIDSDKIIAIGAGELDGVQHSEARTVKIKVVR